MAVIRPFSCIRPEPSLAGRIASGPHSSMTAEEIRKKIEDNPLTYTRIVHPKFLYAEYPKDPDEPYLAAAENLEQWVREGIMLEDMDEAFYLYRLEYQGHVQTGLVGRVALDDITEGRVRAHESIRENKLRDLSHHMKLCRAQVGGPILMTYPGHEKLQQFIRKKTEEQPLYHFLSENGVWNSIWKIGAPEECAAVQQWGSEIPALYIADGHHRIMSSLKICRDMRAEHPDYTGDEPWNYVTFVGFAAEELRILPYGRLVIERQVPKSGEILRRLRRNFHVMSLREPKEPEQRGEIVMSCCGQWYQLNFREEFRPQGMPEGLDVSILQERILRPVLGIGNDRRDSRLEFVGGENQLERMKRKCRSLCAIGFLLYPTSMEEIFRVADCGAIMPPKSTWFTPKLCNGLFIYRIYPKKEQNT